MNDFILFESHFLIPEKFSKKSHASTSHGWEETTTYNESMKGKEQLTLMDHIPIEVFFAAKSIEKLLCLDSRHFLFYIWVIMTIHFLKFKCRYQLLLDTDQVQTRNDLPTSSWPLIGI